MIKHRILQGKRNAQSPYILPDIRAFVQLEKTMPLCAHGLFPEEL